MCVSIQTCCAVLHCILPLCKIIFSPRIQLERSTDGIDVSIVLVVVEYLLTESKVDSVRPVFYSAQFLVVVVCTIRNIIEYSPAIVRYNIVSSKKKRLVLDIVLACLSASERLNRKSIKDTIGLFQTKPNHQAAALNCHWQF